MQDQRDQMIHDLAKILEWQRIHEVNQLERRDDESNDHKAIIKLLEDQNGRVRYNSGKINWVMGVGSAVAFLLSLGIIQAFL